MGLMHLTYTCVSPTDLLLVSLISSVLFSCTDVWSQETDANLSNGKFLYEAYAECASCHGADGKGEVEGLTLDPPPPDFTDCSFTSREPREDWRAVIKHGGQVRGLSPSMPAYDLALTDEQIDAIITYIKTFCAEKGWPPGELNFRRPLITSKAFPESEALFIPTYTDAQNDEATSKFVYERRVGRRGHWEISLPLHSRFGSNRDFGAGDIEFGTKYVLAENLDHLAILSGGVDLGIPSGKSGIGVDDGSWTFAPYLAAGKGFDSFSLQSNVKLEFPISSEQRDSELFVNVAATFPLTREKKGLYPMVEMNVIKSLETDAASLFLTPQLYFSLVKRGHLGFSIGGQVPIVGDRPFDYRLLAFVLWEYADGGIWW